MDVYRILGNDGRRTHPVEGSVFLKLTQKFL